MLIVQYPTWNKMHGLWPLEKYLTLQEHQLTWH